MLRTFVQNWSMSFYIKVIRLSLPEPVSKTGVHWSSSSALHPEPAPENTRSSWTPGNPEAGVWNRTPNNHWSLHGWTILPGHPFIGAIDLVSLAMQSWDKEIKFWKLRWRLFYHVCQVGDFWRQPRLQKEELGMVLLFFNIEHSLDREVQVSLLH